SDPPRYVDFVIAFDGDLVDQGMNRANLTLLEEIHATGQPHARIYAARTAMSLFHQVIELLRNELGVVLSSTLARLLLAAILGGIIGLERQLRHKPAGLRTNMFIC